MNGSKINIVIDTNVIFMALYDPTSKAGKVINAAIENKIELYTTDTVQEEIRRVLKREIRLQDEEIEEKIRNLPILWIKKEIYAEFINKTKVKHKADKPLEALSILLNCGILSADHHFKNRLDINKF